MLEEIIFFLRQKFDDEDYNGYHRIYFPHVVNKLYEKIYALENKTFVELLHFLSTDRNISTFYISCAKTEGSYDKEFLENRFKEVLNSVSDNKNVKSLLITRLEISDNYFHEIINLAKEQHISELQFYASGEALNKDVFIKFLASFHHKEGLYSLSFFCWFHLWTNDIFQAIIELCLANANINKIKFKTSLFKFDNKICDLQTFQSFCLLISTGKFKELGFCEHVFSKKYKEYAILLMNALNSNACQMDALEIDGEAIKYLERIKSKSFGKLIFNNFFMENLTKNERDSFLELKNMNVRHLGLSIGGNSSEDILPILGSVLKSNRHIICLDLFDMHLFDMALKYFKQFMDGLNESNIKTLRFRDEYMFLPSFLKTNKEKFKLFLKGKNCKINYLEFHHWAYPLMNENCDYFLKELTDRKKYIYIKFKLRYRSYLFMQKYDNPYIKDISYRDYDVWNREQNLLFGILALQIYTQKRMPELKLMSNILEFAGFENDICVKMKKKLSIIRQQFKLSEIKRFKEVKESLEYCENNFPGTELKKLQNEKSILPRKSNESPLLLSSRKEIRQESDLHPFWFPFQVLSNTFNAFFR